MVRTIVNKHLSDGNSITRDYFHENDEYAKGEIIIVNDGEPSIYVLDGELNPKKISGGKQNSISPEVLDEIRKEFKDEDTKILSEVDDLNDTIDDVVLDVNTVKTSVNSVVSEIPKIKKSIQDNHSNIQQVISDTKEEILKHTVNGFAIETNPVLGANDVNVGENYGSTVLPEGTSESIQNNETILVALKKIENMMFANTLAVTASLNDLHRRITAIEDAIGMDDENAKIFVVSGDE